MTGHAVLEVAGTPGSRRFRLFGEIAGSAVDNVVAAMKLTELPCDVVLDVRDLTVGDRSSVLLFSRIAKHLSGRGRLYVIHPPAPVLRLVDGERLEQQLLNLTVVRHPAWPSEWAPERPSAWAWDHPGARPQAPRPSHRMPQLSHHRRG